MARAGRAAYREAVVAAAHGLRDRVVAVGWAASPEQKRAKSVSPPSPRPDRLMPTCWNVGMPALMPRATPVRADNSALLHVLEAYIETLKAENEILKRQLAAAEARAAREAAKAEWAIGEFSALTRRLRARAAERASRG